MDARYEMLVIDLDGTLLGPDGSVSARNRDAMAAARAAGMLVVVATGRALVESLHAMEAIEHDGYAIVAGGSILADAATGATMHRHALDPAVVRDVAGTLIDDGHKVLVLKDAHRAGYDYLAIGPGELDPASAWWFDHLPVEVRYIDDVEGDPHPEDTVRAGIVADESRIAPLAPRLREIVGERAFLQHWAAVTESSVIGSCTHLLEVFHPHVNKWTMVRHLCEQHGIDPGRVAAIGDGLNDIELVAGAGLGVAMANADRRVLEVAARVTDDHAADGVASAVEKILRGAW